MLTNLLAPKVDLASLIMRVGLAAIFIVHGYFKIVQDYPLLEDLSLAAQTAVGWVEIICGLALGLGLFTRFASVVLIGHQIGAIVLVTGKRALSGPSIKTTGADYTKVGPEFNLALIAMCLALILLGSGAVSLDSILWRAWRRKAPVAPAQPAPATATAQGSEAVRI